MSRSSCPILLAALGGALLAQGPIPIAPLSARPPAGAAVAGASRAIDLVICLDVSGSMSGLINAARQNLWAVVNDLATLQPAPDLRVALLTYGNPSYGAESGFVAVQTGLTDDLDTVSAKLFALGTNGGDEYVARVVKRALDDLAWSPDRDALKLVFVAGNEPATQDPVLDAFAQSKAAIERGILVNTIFCGDPKRAEADGWRNVAMLADGKFAAIEQDAAVVIETPFDAQLAELSAKLNTTYVPYGAEASVWAANQVEQDRNAVGMNVAAAAQRCQTKASGLYTNARWDLVDACRDATFELAKVEKKDLPAELRELSLEELEAHVAKKRAERDALQKEVAELGAERDAFVTAERKKLGEAGEKLFERAVLESVREQAKSRGFVRPAPARAEQPPTQPREQPADGAEGSPTGGGADGEPDFARVVRDAVEGYAGFVRVTGQPHVAPTLCRMPPGPFVRVSEAAKEHGGKLYLLYARYADGLAYVQPGEPAKVGQTLVKEAWQRVAGRQQGPTEASERYPAGLTLAAEGEDCHAGDALGLFVMHKLAPDTKGTDLGWVYGTVDRDGRVTAAGRIASCMRCHRDAEHDRRFGLD